MISSKKEEKIDQAKYKELCILDREANTKTLADMPTEGPALGE